MDENLYESRSAAPWNRNQTAETVENAPPETRASRFTCIICGLPVGEYPQGNVLGKEYWVHGRWAMACQKCQTALVEGEISKKIRGDSR